MTRGILIILVGVLLAVFLLVSAGLFVSNAVGGGYAAALRLGLFIGGVVGVIAVLPLTVWSLLRRRKR